MLYQVLCTTSTLAMGVNLPAHLVVIKGTRRYIGAEAEDASGYQEYERSTCLQACWEGRLLCHHVQMLWHLLLLLLPDQSRFSIQYSALPSRQ